MKRRPLNLKSWTLFFRTNTCLSGDLLASDYFAAKNFIYRREREHDHSSDDASVLNTEAWGLWGRWRGAGDNSGGTEMSTEMELVSYSRYVEIRF